MKTEKQIKLLEEERGKKYEAMICNMDRIEIPDMKRFFKNTIKFPNNQNLNFMPILKNGVLTLNYENAIGYLIFEVSNAADEAGNLEIMDGINEDICNAITDMYMRNPGFPIIRIHLDSIYRIQTERILNEMSKEKRKLIESYKTNAPDKYQEITDMLNPKPQWIYSCDAFITLKPDDSFDAIYSSFTTPESVILNKQGRKCEYSSEYVGDKTRDFNALMLTMAWLNYINEHPEIKEVTRMDRHSKAKPAKNTASRNTSDDQTTRRIVLNGIKIVSTNSNLVKKLASKKRQHFVETWAVRGHYRHYASGKVVYVRPYTKGKKDGKKIQKIYVVE